jgi:HlyD family secretion protein
MPDSPRPWWTRRLWWLIAALVLVGLAVAGWLTRAQPVAVFTVSAQPLVRTLQFTGRVKTPARVDVGVTVTGRVLQVRVREGDLVTAGIRKRVDAMLQQNDVGADRILSVKRDAVFVTGPAPGRLILQDGTRFKIKGSYTSFASLGGVEVYAVPRRGIADLKGIPDERRELHAKFITRMVLDVLGMIERNNLVEAADTLQQFRRDYAARLLPLGFYREFNSTSAYAVRAGDNVFHLDGESDVDRSAIEIAYNLKNVVVPLARAIA